MASFSVQTAKHATLTAATVDSVTLAQQGRYIQIVHRGALANPLYVTLGKTPADPTAGGDNTIVVLSGSPVVVPWPHDSVATTTVKLISAGAEPYSVQMLNDRLS